MESTLRLTVFLSVLVVLLAAERMIPWKVSRPLGIKRWTANFGLVALGSLTIHIALPLAAVGAAIFAKENNIGLFNWQNIPIYFAIPLTIVLMDFIIYWQHRVFHNVPWLWRLHRVHHADPEMDASTGLRFHPIEIWLSMWVKIIVVLVLGLPPEGVIAFEIILNAASMFEHAAISIPKRIDRVLGYIIVTPNLHRIHHSEKIEETNSHYGFCLSIWDRIFKSWRGSWSEELVLGVRDYRDKKEQNMLPLLTQPFR